MSHVDEGRLHAFLDGALGAADPADAERVELHLAACADCRTKLDEAAALRDEAGALLGAATPRAFDMPSFESIRARSAAIIAEETPTVEAGTAAVRSTPRRGWRHATLATPFNGFAWAATIVLAVGLGWMLRESVDDSTRVPIRSMSGDAIEEGRPAPSEAVPEIAAADRSAAEPGSGAVLNSAPPSAIVPRRTGTSGEAVDRRFAEEGFESRAAPQQGARESMDALAESDAGRPPAVSPPPPPPSVAASPERRADYDVASDRAAGLGAASSGEAYAVAPSGWQAIPVDEARRILGGRLAVPVGASIISASRSAGSALEVRTVQRTSRGETIEVVQRPAVALNDARAQSSSRAEAAQAPAAPADAKPSSTVRWGDWTVTISGAVSADRLEELTDQLP